MMNQKISVTQQLTVVGRFVRIEWCDLQQGTKESIDLVCSAEIIFLG
jgi:hypothetical protein